MIRSLQTAATGMEAQQANVDQIANDLANVNTDGFKRGRTEFHDLMYETTKEPGGKLGQAAETPVGIQTGLGVKVGAAHQIFEQGSAKQTGNNLDVMIEGKGFFPVQRPNGEIAYTRVGAFHRDSTGKLVMSNGAMVLPQITVPPNALSLAIMPNGQVKASLPGNEQAELGQIQLVSFVNENGLAAMGGGLYRATPGSGTPQSGIPGENGFGGLAQGALEASNVDVASSMVNMIKAQRGYELNAKVIDTANKMLGVLTEKL